VKEHNLLELIGEKRPDSRTLAGSEKEFFGGTTLRGLVDGMAFGGFQLNHIPVNLSLGAHGAYASPFFSGNIGETILSRFKRVWLDYPRNRLILQPGPDVGAPFPEHRSFGLTLLSDGPDLNIFRVTEVTRDSPAQKAGFEKGDVIAGVDSTPANQLTLGKLRELLSQEGTQHAFAVKREDKELKIQVTVEDTPISNIH
jgi:membrane-associated protease RseP (regulator of RpoE activity)